MSRRSQIIYKTVLFVSIAIIVCAFLFTSKKPQNNSMHVIKPTSIIQTAPYVREFIFDTTDFQNNQCDIGFFTKHQKIQVYSNASLIYEYVTDGDIWGHTTGAYWSFVDVPHDCTELKIIFTSAYDEVKNDIPNFYLGDKLSIYHQVIINSLPATIISLLILVFGIVLILYWVFVSRGFDIGKSMLYLGLFSSIIGFYLLNETDAVIAIIEYRTASVLLTYLALMLLSPTAIFFIKEFLNPKENIIWKILCSLSLAQFIICTLLQFFGIADLRETLFISHILMGATALYLLCILFVKLYRREYTPMLKASVVSVCVLSLCVFFNLATYYQNTAISDTSVASRLGFLLFIFILSAEAAKNAFALMEAGRQAKIYEELAIKDMLTGLENRNAYIHAIDTMDDYKDILLITFDLNNLKKCNDSLGHAEGDHYILSAAHIIQDIFSAYGSCYRIGGDEFCAIIPNGTACPIGQLTTLFESAQQDFNDNNPSFEMCISYGYAIFDNRIDMDLEQTRDRADALMYENKRKTKGSR